MGKEETTAMESQFKTKTKRFKVKHPKRKLFRAREPLLSVFMWGVNHSVRELQHIHAPVMLMPDDFRSFSKIKIDNYAFNKENLPSHFKVKEYCPLVFRNLRERFGISDEDFLSSLISKCPKPKESHKSGMLCYTSHDGLYVIYTLSTDQVEEMHCYLKHYHPYIVERHGKTLLPQYLAMYRLTVDNIETYLVVIRNVFSSHLRVHKKYNLKGSTIDREASEKERGKKCPTLKDNDFLNDDIKINIGEAAKEKLLETLAADVQFLTKNNIMGYSLLLGLHDVSQGLEEGNTVDGDPDLDDDEEYDSAGSGGASALTPPDSPASPRSPDQRQHFFRRANSTVKGRIDPDRDIYAIPSRDLTTDDSSKVYFLSIVDVLTYYGVKKVAAKAAKTMKYGSGVDGISTVEPEQYAKRFLAFISDAIE